MQTVKKDLIKGVEAEGEFCQARISSLHLEELRKLLEDPCVKYGDVKSALCRFKRQMFGK